MLSQSATDLNIALCEKIEGNNFVIFAWEDIAALMEECEISSCQELFEELRLNACVNLKYKDEEQACFSMTDKARIITSEIQALLNTEGEQETLVKTDSDGNAVFVIPKTKAALENISNKKTSKIGGFWAGFLGGIVSSGIFYAIIYLIEKLF